MKFENLSETKFAPLSTNEKLTIRGGAEGDGDTEGGSKVIWEGMVQVPCEGQSGGVNYNTVYMKKVHIWSSDAIIDGRTCLWGEGYGWVE